MQTRRWDERKPSRGRGYTSSSKRQWQFLERTPHRPRSQTQTLTSLRPRPMQRRGQTWPAHRPRQRFSEHSTARKRRGYVLPRLFKSTFRSSKLRLRQKQRQRGREGSHRVRPTQFSPSIMLRQKESRRS